MRSASLATPAGAVAPSGRGLTLRRGVDGHVVILSERAAQPHFDLRRHWTEALGRRPIDLIAQAGREAFTAWGAVIARALVRDGFSRTEARRLATLTISAIEGALILSRVEASAAPIEDVAKSLGVMLKNDAKRAS